MRPIAENIFADLNPPQLLGGKHKLTGRVVFPLPEGDMYEPVKLGRFGSVWTYTIQRFRPKSPPYTGPDDFAPYPIAYVTLPGDLILEARLTNIANEDVRIGIEVELTAMLLDEGDHSKGYIPAFQPVTEGEN